ncbi:endonuclease III [Candidatus Pacearchaeota archaeon]|nr:endonuclease III [Candidatus Pacearchaeota archaeon]
MKRNLKQLAQLKKLGKPMRLAAEDWKNNYEILFSTILSARTRDEITIPTSEKLFKIYPTTKSLANAQLRKIQRIIKSVNFYKNKSKNILACAKKIEKEYVGKIPLNFEQLIQLPGVGRKTANVFLSEIGKNAIGVDTHVGHIAQKLKWSNSKKPAEIEKDLKKLFPKKYWKQLNSILVTFGKTYTSRKLKNEILEKIRKIK